MTQPVDIQRYVEIWAPFAYLLAPSMRNEDTTSDYCQRWIQGVIYIMISLGVLLGLGGNFKLYLTQYVKV